MTNKIDIGRVFTPTQWGMWLIETTGIFDKWIGGASILDPTCGDGALLEAFFMLAKNKKIKITKSMIARLHGVEIVASDKPKFISRVKEKYHILFPEDNFVIADFVKTKITKRYDCLIGNPPWINYTDLPDYLKNEWKQYFIDHNIVVNKKDVLLGGSRADLASLIMKKAIDDALIEDGIAAFFLPLSLFFNSGANDAFRPYPGSTHTYSVSELWDFADEKVFDNIATRYGVALFNKKSNQKWPVKTHVYNCGSWEKSYSTASDDLAGSWQRHSTKTNNLIISKMSIRKEQQPRQGVNTCGANDILIFKLDGNKFVNGLDEEVSLEDELLYPLLDSNSFDSTKNSKMRYILLSHDIKTGHPLSWIEICNYPKVKAYLLQYKEQLSNRKGVLINSHIKRGDWWSLLGVGPYSFAPWKVVWESLGKKELNPIIVDGKWQGNQALHAFSACQTKKEAEDLQKFLSDPKIEDYLKSSNMEGTCNWAQPGRVKKLLDIQ